MKLQKYIKEIIITLLIISFTTAWYAAVLTVNDWDTLTSTIWNQMKDIVNANESKLVNVSNDGVTFNIGYEIVTNSLYNNPWTGSYAVDATCPVGKKVISWGCYNSRSNYDNSNIYRDYPLGDNIWRCASWSTSTADLTLTAYAICANVQ